MNGVAVAVHQSSSRSEKRKLVSITRSPSVAVVSEIAPRWITASSRRPFSHSPSSAGGTISANCRLARLRHLPSWPSVSHTTTSACPASFSAATTFDPIKPAPPVTSNMNVPFLPRPLLPDQGAAGNGGRGADRVYLVFNLAGERNVASNIRLLEHPSRICYSSQHD